MCFITNKYTIKFKLGQRSLHTSDISRTTAQLFKYIIQKRGGLVGAGAGDSVCNWGGGMGGVRGIYSFVLM